MAISFLYLILGPTLERNRHIFNKVKKLGPGAKGATTVAEDNSSGFEESFDEEKSQNNNQKANDFREFLESFTSAQVDSAIVNMWSRLLKALERKAKKCF